MSNFFGGPIISVLLKLVIASVGVGIVLAVFGIEPWQLWEDFLGTVRRIWDLGFDVVDWSVKYFLLGAIIVIPLWLFVRLWVLLFERPKK